MSSRRRSRSSSRSRQQSGNNIASSRSINDGQIIDLVSKLQLLIPSDHYRRSTLSNKASASSILQETCTYIGNLHREVDDLSERLSELLASTEINSTQAAIIRSLLVM